MAEKHDLKSFKLNIPNGENQGIISWTLDVSVSLVAIHIFPINAILEDTVTIQLFYGDTLIGIYAENTHIINNNVVMNFDRQDPLQVPAGITIKLIYDSIDTNGRDFILWVRYKQ